MGRWRLMNGFSDFDIFLRFSYLGKNALELGILRGNFCKNVRSQKLTNNKVVFDVSDILLYLIKLVP